MTAMLPVGLVAWRTGRGFTNTWHCEWMDDAGEPRHLTACGKVVPRDPSVSRHRTGLAPLCKRCLVALDRQAAAKLVLEK